MNRRPSRRKRWMRAIAGGFLVVALLLFSTRKDLTVVVYNNTNRPFQNVAVSVGNTQRERASLEVRESGAFGFQTVETPSDVRLSIEADPPLRWSAPSLATPSVSRVTLRVDEFGTVTMTLEKTWAARVSECLE